MNRSGRLIARNDPYIEILLKDDRYDIREDGSILTTVCVTGSTSTSAVWRNCVRSKNGYCAISYTVNGSRKQLLVHRIIYAKFKGKLEEDLMINHKNGVTTDNSPDNLELDTQSHNNIHRFRVLKTAPVIGNKKISDEIADAIRDDHAHGMSYKQLIEKYELAKSSISYIINKKTWNRNVESEHQFQYKTKLNLEIAEQIRREYADGTPQKILQKKYGVGLTTIKDVCAGRKWKVPTV